MRPSAVGWEGDEGGQRGPHAGVAEQHPGQPGHLAGGRVGDQRQALERGAPLAAGPRGRHRQRLAVAGRAQPLQRRHRVGGLGQLGDLGLQHLGRRAAEAQVLAQGLGQALGQAVELEEVEQAPHLVDVGGPAVQLVDGHAEGDVAHQPHHLLVEPHLVFVLGQVGPQLGRLLVEVLEDAVEAAVGVDELGRGLLPHPGHPWQVVGGVAPQRRVLAVEPGRDPGALLDAGLVVEHVVGHAPAVVEHLDVGVLDHLVHVAVAGDDDGVEPGVAGLRGQSRDDVVGLVARQLEQPDAEHLDHLAHQPDLLAEDVGRRGPPGLVGGDPLVAERRLGPVERHRHAPVPVVAHEVDEHRREPEHRVGHLARRGGEVGGQGEEGAVGERVPVDEQERIVGHGGGRQVSGVISPSMMRRDTSRMVTRSDMARRWMKLNAVFSFMPNSSMSLPLARSTIFRVSSCSSRLAVWSASALISLNRPSATSTAGTSSLRSNGLTR
jgi:hypothetical protein